MSTNKRVFFGPWESYFLLAEAAVKGWKVPGTAKSNYESGVTASFEYHGLLSQVGDYLSSQKYNRVGTSVAFDLRQRRNHIRSVIRTPIRRR